MSNDFNAVNESAEGYDRFRFGYDSKGFDRMGFNWWGIHRTTATFFDADGYDRFGYDRDGYDRDGYDRNGYNRDGYDRDGYDSNGYDRDGYDSNGYNRIDLNNALTKNLIMVLTAPEKILSMGDLLPTVIEPLKGSKITLQATIETPNGSQIQGASKYVYVPGEGTVISNPNYDAS